jgi:HEAT repeat protein
MYTSLAPLFSAWLVLAAPPPTQTPTVRSPNDNTVVEVGGKTYRQWVDDLKHPDASVREEAIRSLVFFGHDSVRAIPLIVERLQQDNDCSPRVKAAIALGMIQVPKEDIPNVARALGQRLLQDSQAIVRYYSAATLNNFGEDAKYGLAGLVKGVSDPSTWEIRHACIAALRTAGRDPRGGPNPNVEHALVGALRDPTYRVRLEAILAIGALGRPEDRNLFMTVIQALQDRLANEREPAVKIWVHVALMALDEVTDKSLQAVIRNFKSSDPKVRIEAARALGAIGSKIKSKAPMVEPALIAALQDKDVTAVGAAAQALAELDELSASGRSSLLDLLRSPEPTIRASVAQAFGAAGIKARAAVPVLTTIVQDKDQPPYVVASACWALGEIGEPAPATLAALNAVGQRKDVDESLKQVAQTALDQINKLKK